MLQQRGREVRPVLRSAPGADSGTQIYAERNETLPVVVAQQIG